MDRGIIDYLQAEILRKYQDNPRKEIELLMWDGFSYDQAYPKRIKVIGKIEVIAQVLEKFGPDFEECDFSFI